MKITESKLRRLIRDVISEFTTTATYTGAKGGRTTYKHKRDCV